MMGSNLLCTLKNCRKICIRPINMNPLELFFFPSSTSRKIKSSNKRLLLPCKSPYSLGLWCFYLIYQFASLLSTMRLSFCGCYLQHPNACPFCMYPSLHHPYKNSSIYNTKHLEQIINCTQENICTIYVIRSLTPKIP
jgi:hypothetical protein